MVPDDDDEGKDMCVLCVCVFESNCSFENQLRFVSILVFCSFSISGFDLGFVPTNPTFHLSISLLSKSISVANSTRGKCGPFALH